jgi:3-dehydroquinate dehydratase-2
MRIDLIHGPNLNLLGRREPEIYGATTLAELEQLARDHAASLGATLTAWQSNHEGALVDRIHEDAANGVDAVIINAGAYTHTSIALRDAFVATGLPFVEVHISNVHAREGFRHHSYLSAIASGVIVGCGIDGYRLAIERLAGVARWGA